MAVSCRAGSGRTETYICCYLILNEIKNQIDRGIPAHEVSLNIDKIVWLMSVQRPFAVTHLPQYKCCTGLPIITYQNLKQLC
jgi:protein tyrosine phosphatase